MESCGDPNTVQDGLVEPRNSPGRCDLSGLYQLGRTLGRGHFAVVKLARHVNTGQLVAVKMIDKTKLDIMATSHLLQEVRCMRLVQHPNVVRLYEVIDTPTTLYLVMELAEGGDLYDYILRHEGGVAEGTAKRHFAQIVRAVAYCHQLHVVHRDLKPENVVFFPQQGAVKLTDFGFSNLFQPGTMLATSCGSLAYSAPEILLGEEYDAPAVDIWSLGVILYMLVCGVPPFQETNDSETLVMILDCRYSVPKHVSDDCKDLISRMLQKDPSLRASLEDIEAHQWLQGLDDALLSPEAPPHWLSGALSYRAGAPECGDLLAARPSSQQPPPPASWQPSLNVTLRPAPTEEPPIAKNLPALQQICEEEDEEEEEEGGLVDEGKGLASLLEEEEEEEEDKKMIVDDSERVEEEREEDLGSSMEMIEEEEEEEEGKMEETDREDDGFVILDQPVSSGDKPLTPPELPPSSPPCFGVPCCQREKNASDEELEPNNNTDKPHLLSRSSSSSSPTTPDKEEQKTEEKSGQDEPSTEKSQHHNEKAEKRHSIKLRERLFQFPLCEKALAFNIPAHNKPKILPLAQYNCCHVL